MAGIHGGRVATAASAGHGLALGSLHGAASGRRLDALYSPLRVHIESSRLDTDPYSGIGTGPDMTCAGVGAAYTYTQATAADPTGVCTAADVLTTDKVAFLRNTLLPAAVSKLNTLLSVLPVQGQLILGSPYPKAACFGGAGYGMSLMCCEGYMPAGLHTTGMAQTDMIFMVTARPAQAGTIAWALTCQSDLEGRPVAGHINFAPAYISASPADLEDQVSTAVHEMFHALGFSASKFGTFIDPVTRQPLGSSNVVAQFQERGRTVSKLITAPVIEQARLHYGCSSLWTNAGMELEDYGGSGSAGSHLEQRLVQAELMAATAMPHAAYSALSLSVMESSGWYRVDYGAADRLAWGSAAGCSFLTEPCAQWPAPYACSQANTWACSHDHTARAFCAIQQYSSALPTEYQYFSSPYLGGYNAFMDYCPVLYAPAQDACASASTQAVALYGEATGSGSTCFDGTWRVGSMATSQSHPGCLMHSCAGADLHVTLTYSGTEYTGTCPQGGGVLDAATFAPSFAGSIVCPPAADLCSMDPCDGVTCSGNGQCVGGTCLCDAGWTGSSATTCDQRICAWNPATQTNCTGHGACVNDACVCDAGWTGSDCGSISVNCPHHGGVACTSAQSGSCADAIGVCECSDMLGSLVSAAHYYTGVACERSVNGTRAMPQLPIVAAPAEWHSAVHLQLAARSVQYASLQADSASVNLYIEAVADTAVAMLVRYAADGKPTWAQNAAAGSQSGNMTTVVLVRTADSVFARAGAMIVALYNTGNTTANATVRGRVDGCAVRAAQCQHVADPAAPCTNGACQCATGWGGELCNVMICPGAGGGCNGRGTCAMKVGDNVPRCYCTGSMYSGDACQIFTSPGHGLQLPVSGALPHGVTLQQANVTLAASQVRNNPRGANATAQVRALRVSSAGITLPGRNDVHFVIDTAALLDDGWPSTLSISAELRLHLDGAEHEDTEAVLLLGSNVVPTLAEYSAASTAEWASGAILHRVQYVAYSLGASTTTSHFVVTVSNSRFARSSANYTLSLEISSACPTMWSSCTTGGSVCNLQTQQCACAPGREGTACDTDVQSLPWGALDTRWDIPAGSIGKAFRGAIPPGAKRVAISAAFQGYEAGDAHLKVAIAQPSVPAWAALDGAAAVFDFDALAAKSGVQQVQLDVSSAVSGMELVVGLSPARGWMGRTTATLNVTAAAVNSQSCLAHSSQAACDELHCASRGHYVVSTGSGGLAESCQCDQGWAAAGMCASPSLQSAAMLPTALQSVQYMCSLCSQLVSLPAQGLAVIRVSQPISSRQVLDIVGSAVNSSSNSSSVPVTLLFAPELPRTLLDINAATPARAEVTLRVPTADPRSGSSGWVVVYAHAAAQVRLQAQRSTLPSRQLSKEVFFWQLLSWLTTSSAGLIFLSILACIAAVYIVFSMLLRKVKGRELEKQLQKERQEQARWQASMRRLDVTGLSATAAAAARTLGYGPPSDDAQSGMAVVDAVIGSARNLMQHISGRAGSQGGRAAGPPSQRRQPVERRDSISVLAAKRRERLSKVGPPGMGMGAVLSEAGPAPVRFARPSVIARAAPPSLSGIEVELPPMSASRAPWLVGLTATNTDSTSPQQQQLQLHAPMLAGPHVSMDNDGSPMAGSPVQLSALAYTALSTQQQQGSARNSLTFATIGRDGSFRATDFGTQRARRQSQYV